MTDNSFLDFSFKTPVSGDYLVGFDANGSAEFKTQVQEILALVTANTLTTSICAISGDGITPFEMHFNNGLLTSITT